MAAPSIPLLTRNLDRRTVMLALTALLVLSTGLAIAAGSRPVVVELIRRHQDKPPAEDQLAGLLRALQWADDQN